MHHDAMLQSPYDVLPLESILGPDDVNVSFYLNRLQTADHAAKTPEGGNRIRLPCTVDMDLMNRVNCDSQILMFY